MSEKVPNFHTEAVGVNSAALVFIVVHQSLVALLVWVEGA